MPPLSDIKAECERDSAKMDHYHQQADRLSSDGSGGNPNPPNTQLPYMPPRRRSVEMAAFLGMLAVVAIVIILVLVFFVMPGGSSPTKTYREYVDASNDRDIWRMFNQTVTRFTPDYESRIQNLSSVIFILDPHIDIQNLSVLEQNDMTELEKLSASVIVDDVESVLSVSIEDYCYVEYTISIYYEDIDQTATFPGQVLCVSIDGHWYLAVPGFY